MDSHGFAAPNLVSAASPYLSKLRRDSVGADFQSVRKLTNYRAESRDARAPMSHGRTEGPLYFDYFWPRRRRLIRTRDPYLPTIPKLAGRAARSCHPLVVNQGPVSTPRLQMLSPAKLTKSAMNRQVRLSDSHDSLLYCNSRQNPVEILPQRLCQWAISRRKLSVRLVVYQ